MTNPTQNTLPPDWTCQLPADLKYSILKHVVEEDPTNPTLSKIGSTCRTWRGAVLDFSRHLLTDKHLSNDRVHIIGPNTHFKTLTLLVNLLERPCYTGCLKEGGDINAIDHKQWTLLHHAAIANDEAIVRFLLEEGARIDALDIVGRTPAMLALREGNVSLAKFLIKRGSDLSIKDLHRNTILHHLACTPSRDNDTLFTLTDTLITRGLDVNARNEKGESPLMLAAKTGNLKLMQHLLSRWDANIQPRDFQGWSIPDCLAGSPHPDDENILKAFDSFPKLDAANRFNGTPCDSLTIALLSGKFRLARHLHQKYPNLPADGSELQSVIKFDLCKEGLPLQQNEDLLLQQFDLFIEMGFPVDSEDSQGKTSLMTAIQNWRFKLARHLMNRWGADPLLMRNNSMSTLHALACCPQGSPELLDLCDELVQQRVRVNSVTKFGKTPLQNAIEARNFQLARHLVTRHQASCEEGYETLHKVIKIKDLTENKKNEQLLLCDALIEQGFDVNSPNQQGLRPLTVAIHASNPELACHLIATHQADVTYSILWETPLHDIASSNFCLLDDDQLISLWDLLISSGADIDAQTPEGSTALMMALDSGKYNLASHILHRYSPNLALKDDESGKTVLHVLIKLSYSSKLSREELNSKWIDLCDTLIQKGADVNAQDEEGRTPLMDTLELEEYVDLAVHLIKHHKADVNLTNKYGGTALHLLNWKLLEKFLPVFEAILEVDADVNALCAGEAEDRDISPLELALAYKQVTPALRLIEKGARGDLLCGREKSSLLYVLIKESGLGESDMILLSDALIGAGADMHVRNTKGVSALEYAIQSGYYKLAQHLIKNHNTTENDQAGHLLHLLASCGPDDEQATLLCDTLIQNGAQINIKLRVLPPTSLLKELEDVGMPPNIDDLATDMTPLSIAIEAGKKNLARHMMKKHKARVISSLP